MSIDDLTLTDLTIVKDTFVVTVDVCEQFCILFMNRVLRIA
jgi:hypothetical protein